MKSKVKSKKHPFLILTFDFGLLLYK